MSLPKKRKLGPKTDDCVFLGYAKNRTTYRFLVVKPEVSDIATNVMMESRDATFFEHVFPMRPNEVIDPIGSSEHSILLRVDNTAPELELRRSKRQTTEKSLGDDYVTYVVDDEPRTLSEAYASPDVDYWKEAIRSEMDSIIANGT